MSQVRGSISERKVNGNKSILNVIEKALSKDFFYSRCLAPQFIFTSV
jgi:hypothetical protein